MSELIHNPFNSTSQKPIMFDVGFSLYHIQYSIIKSCSFYLAKKLNLSLIKVLELTSGSWEIEEERDKLNDTSRNQTGKSTIWDIL